MMVQNGAVLENQGAVARGKELGGAAIRGKIVYETPPSNLISTNINDWESGHYGTGGDKGVFVSRIRLINLWKIPDMRLYFNANGPRDSFRFILRTFNNSQVFFHNIGEIPNGYISNFPAGTGYLGISIFDNTTTALTFADYQTMFANGTLKPWISLAALGIPQL